SSDVVCSAGARCFGTGSFSVDECFRASILDGLRISSDTDHPDRKREALAVFRLIGRTRVGEQALNADLRLRSGGRAGADARALMARFAVVLGRGRHRVSDLSAQPAMEYSKPLPFPRTASQYPAQREGCGPLTDNVSRPGNPGDAAIELTDLVGRLVVS